VRQQLKILKTQPKQLKRENNATRQIKITNGFS
jgi:hypothetical protein